MSEERTANHRSWGEWGLEIVQKYAAWLVLALVLCLLQGPWGAAVRLKTELGGVAHSFLGEGQEDTTAVLMRTMPLALTAAAFTFLWLRRWYPSGLPGVYLAFLVIGSAGWVGTQLSQQTGTQMVSGSTVGGAAPMATSPPTPPSEPTAMLSLSQWSLPHEQKGTAPAPVEVLPTGLPHLAGAFCGAVNQIAGYLWAYGINLFLASLVVGTYLGWKGHHLLARATTASVTTFKTVESAWRRAA